MISAGAMSQPAFRHAAPRYLFGGPTYVRHQQMPMTSDDIDLAISALKDMPVERNPISKEQTRIYWSHRSSYLNQLRHHHEPFTFDTRPHCYSTFNQPDKRNALPRNGG